MSLSRWRSCPVCAQPLAHAELHVACAACGFVQYENPAATTLALVVRRRELLLVRRAQAPRAGFWDTIGGFVDPGETAEECVRREVREEVGAEVTGLVPLGTFASTYGETGRRTLGIAFVCRLLGDGALRLSDENDAARWFAVDDLPELAFADGDDAVAALLGDWDALVGRLTAT
jgi:ADP-ribose pyrophosphatase YjhB (NUDIX family)